jgi:hypothetical protein
LPEEPAFEVFRLYAEGVAVNDIITVCTEKYGHLEGDIAGFANDIIVLIQHFNNAENAVSVSVNPSRIRPAKNGSSFRERTYKTNNKTISVQFQNEYLEFSLHRLFAYLEVTKAQEPEHRLELFENSTNWFLQGKK